MTTAPRAAYTAIHISQTMRKSEVTIMGDKSPKATKKQATQKTAKDDGAQKKKNDAASAKQGQSATKK